MISADQSAAYRKYYLANLARRPSPKPGPAIGDTITVFLVDRVVVVTGKVETYTGVLEAQGNGRLVVRGEFG